MYWIWCLFYNSYWFAITIVSHILKCLQTAQQRDKVSEITAGPNRRKTVWFAPLKQLTALSSVILHKLFQTDRAPQQWKISIFFMTFQKRLNCLTQSWAICQRHFYCHETPWTSGSCYCAQISLTHVHISRAKRFFYFIQTNEKSLKSCSAGEKLFHYRL